MADDSLVLWMGRSGRKYAYYAYPLGQRLCAASGNFIYAHLNGWGQWEPVHIGESDDRAAATTETMLALAREKGATHLHAHLTLGNREGRFDEQEDLRARFSCEPLHSVHEEAPRLAATNA